MMDLNMSQEGWNDFLTSFLSIFLGLVELCCFGRQVRVTGAGDEGG